MKIGKHNFNSLKAFQKQGTTEQSMQVSWYVSLQTNKNCGIGKYVGLHHLSCGLGKGNKYIKQMDALEAYRRHAGCWVSSTLSACRIETASIIKCKKKAICSAIVYLCEKYMDLMTRDNMPYHSITSCTMCGCQ